jgi:hypothetical protein
MEKPTILVIDDELADATNVKRALGEDAHVIARTPDSFTRTDLREADLVLIDYELTEWDGADSALTSPPNGLALSAVVREQVNKHRRGAVTGVALYSGELGEISGTLPDELRGFALARLNNLEWVFEKGEASAFAGIVSLARAIRRLPRPWPGEPVKAATRLHELLALEPTAAFFQTAADDISSCHPPIHELSSSTHALAVIRWIAHRILPYPAFLTERIGLAARLRLDLDELERLLEENSQFAGALHGTRYQGVLCELYGPHWWRSGLDELALQWTSGAGGIAALHEAIATLAGRDVRFLAEEVVPGIDETYRANGLIALDEALRLQPDDWPPFADDAWAPRELVETSRMLRGLVVPTDLELLDTP